MPGSTLDIILNILKKGRGGEETEKELSGVEKAAQTAGKALLAYVSVESIKATYELAKLGAESLRTKQAFEAISGGADEASDRLEAMQDATRGALSEQQAMASANQLMQMGLANSSEELAQLAEMATRLGGAMGKDATASLEEFSLLLANQSIPRLDTFGISAGKVRTRINELTSTVAGMTREQAFMTAVMEEGQTSMDRLGPAVDDAALSFERAEATAADFRAELGERLAPAISNALDAGMLLLTWNEQLAEAQAEHAENTLMTATSYEEYVSELTRAAGVTGMVVNAQGDLVQVYQAHGRIMEEVVQANFALSESGFNVARAVDAVRQTVDLATVGWANASEVMYGQTEAAIVAREGMEKLNESGSRVTKTFGEMVFDNETLWNMALASGASTDTLAALAMQLGIATNAEIQHALAGQQLVDQFGAGALTAEELADGFHDLATAQSVAAVQTANLEKETRGVIQGISGIASADEDAAAQALELANAEQIIVEAQQEHIETAGALTDEIIVLEESFAETTYSADDLRENLDQVAESELETGREAARMGLAMQRGAQKAALLREDALLLNEGLQGTEMTAGRAADKIDSLGDELGTTEEKLRAIVAGSPWTFSVSGSMGGGGGGGGGGDGGGPQPDIFGGGGTTTTDNRQFRNTTTINNYITDPMAAMVTLEEQRRITAHRIQSDF